MRWIKNSFWFTHKAKNSKAKLITAMPVICRMHSGYSTLL